MSKRKLSGIEALGELSRSRRMLGVLPEQCYPLQLIFSDSISKGAWLSADFGCDGREEAALRPPTLFHLANEPVAKGEQPLATSWQRERRSHHFLGPRGSVAIDPLARQIAQRLKRKLLESSER